MKTTVNSLREDYHRLYGDPESKTSQPANWRVYAEWLEERLTKQSKDSLDNYLSEAEKKKRERNVLFAAKIHYARKFILKYNPSNTSKKAILLRLDQAKNITQLRKEYKQIILEFEPLIYEKIL